MILLINPPSTRNNPAYPPLALLVLAAYLRHHGFDVYIEDLNLKYKLSEHDIDKFIKISTSNILLKHKKTLFFGFTCDYSNLISAQQIALNIKKSKPKSFIIFGGSHPSNLGNVLKRSSPWIDIVIKGSGEMPLLNILKYSQITSNKTNTHESAMWLDYTANDIYSSIDLSDYLQQPIKPSYFYIEGGRGCNGCCTYCSAKNIYAQTVRYRNPSLIYDEMTFINNKTGINYFWITMDNFASSTKQFEDFVEFMKLHNIHNHKWRCYCRVDNLRCSQIKSLKLAGCQNIFLGIESYSEKKRHQYNKYFSNAKLDSLIKCLYDSDLNYELSFIIEPDENSFYRDIVDTYNFILQRTKKKSRVHISILDLICGSYLYEKHFCKIKRSCLKISINEFKKLYELKQLTNTLILYPEIYSTCTDALYGVINRNVQAMSFIYNNFFQTLCFVYSGYGIEPVMKLVEIFTNILRPAWYGNHIQDNTILRLIMKVFKTFELTTMHNELFRKHWEMEYNDYKEQILSP